MQCLGVVDLRSEYHAKSVDGKLYFAMSTHIIKRCLRSLKNKANANPYDLEYYRKMLVALKQIPKEYGQYIYIRFLKGDILNQKEMCKILNISESKAHRLMNNSYDALCKQMFENELENYVLQEWETLEKVFAKEDFIRASLRLKDSTRELESFEIIESIEHERSYFNHYIVKAHWSRWIRKGE